MRLFRPFATLLLFTTVTAAAAADEAPKNELAFGIGGIPSGTRGILKADAGTALQLNYARRFWSLPFAAIYGEVNVVASPQRQVISLSTIATHDFATLYVTPGIKVKFLPGSRLSPWAVIGGGYGDYEQSTLLLNGAKNPAPRELGRGVFDIGAGVDYRLWHFIALRGEVRDFYTGSPNYNIPTIAGGQNNVAASGSLVLRWH